MFTTIVLLLSVPAVLSFPKPTLKAPGKCRTSLSMVMEGYPGELPPTGFFDPLGLSIGKSEEELKVWREAELKHGRVAMLAAAGILVAERFHPLFGGQIQGTSIFHFQEVLNLFPNFWIVILASIGIFEAYTISKGWESPQETMKKPSGLARLKEEYIPGNLGFDPLNLAPVSKDDFFDVQNKELQNGRLAMLAVAGMVAQELVDGRTIFGHIAEFGFGPGKPYQ